jgi:hypothetical protein
MTRTTWLALPLVAGVVVYLVSALPESFSTDLSRVGTAPVTVVAVHDTNLLASIEMMDLMGSVKDAYGDEVLVLVADLNTRPGRAFSTQHGASAVSLLLFSSEGERVDTVVGDLTAELVERRIDRALEGIEP